jgi:hypothetical protein
MKRPHRNQQTTRGPKTRPPDRRERAEEYQAVIEPDPLLKEVGEANEQIADPAERERVVPSKPC